MYLENLRINHAKFISYLKDNDYSADFIGRIRRMIKIILEKSDSMSWNSYFDVFQHFERKQARGGYCEKEDCHRSNHGI